MKHNNLKTKAYHSNLPAYIYAKWIPECTGIIGNFVSSKYANVEIDASYYAKFNVTKKIEEEI